MENVDIPMISLIGIFYGHFIYILCPFGNLVYISPVLVFFTRKKLATLTQLGCDPMNKSYLESAFLVGEKGEVNTSYF
jgi:hypothetical protein